MIGRRINVAIVNPVLTALAFVAVMGGTGYLAWSLSRGAKQRAEGYEPQRTRGFWIVAAIVVALFPIALVLKLTGH